MVNTVLPEEDEQEESARAAYARAVGSRLRAVRKQMRLSLQAVEAMSDQEFKASVLGAYERGERAISVPRLQRLAKLYDVPVDQLLPQDDDATRWGPNGEGNGNGGESPGRARRQLRPWDGHDKVTIDLTKLNSVSGPERDLHHRRSGAHVAGGELLRVAEPIGAASRGTPGGGDRLRDRQFHKFDFGPRSRAGDRH